MILELARLLKPITLAKSPLSTMPDRKNKIDKWAAPKYWAEVEYRDITTDGLLRHVEGASTPTGPRRRRSLASSRLRGVFVRTAERGLTLAQPMSGSRRAPRAAVPRQTAFRRADKDTSKP